MPRGSDLQVAIEQLAGWSPLLVYSYGQLI